jgi:hypothetical protein
MAAVGEYRLNLPLRVWTIHEELWKREIMRLKVDEFAVE